MSSPHIVLITGANTGIGLEVVKSLAKSSKVYNIILGGRTPSKVEAAIEALKVEIPETKSTFEAVQIDVTDDESIKAAYQTIAKRHDHVHTLVNNAGAAFDLDLAQGKMSMREAWNKAWDVNVTGAQITTWTFAPLLVKAAESAVVSTDGTCRARLLFLTSGTASIIETFSIDSSNRLTQAPSAGWPKTDLGFDVSAYRSSKVGLNMMMRQWERILRKDSVLTFAISPGFLASGLGNAGEEGKEIMRKMGAKEPHLGGEFIRDVIEGKRDEDAGLAIGSDRIQPW